jgi:hypothetical protein
MIKPLEDIECEGGKAEGSVASWKHTPQIIAKEKSPESNVDWAI